MKRVVALVEHRVIAAVESVAAGHGGGLDFPQF
jgi:hypothetical protein